MTATFWRAELYRNNRLRDTDFPMRNTVVESLNDARERIGSLSDSERTHLEAFATEWEGDECHSTNTGRTAPLGG